MSFSDYLVVFIFFCVLANPDGVERTVRGWVAMPAQLEALSSKLDAQCPGELMK